MAERRSALAHFPAQESASGRLSLSELRPTASLQVQAWPDGLSTVKGVMGELLGHDVPAVGHAVATDVCVLIATGPGRFLIADTAGSLLDRFERTLPAGVGAVTELTHGRTILRLDGEAAVALLAKCVAIDLDPAAFPAGRVAQTMIHHIDVTVHRRGEAIFDLWVLRSFAEALAEWLLDAGMEFDATFAGSLGAKPSRRID